MDATPLTQVSVLVVEDHEDTRHLLEFVLLDAGALVQTAASAGDALRLLQVTVPDVVLIDLGMTGRDGYWLLSAIQSLAAEKPVRTIAVTAHVLPRERDRALAAGFDAFLTKPFLPQQLVNVISTLVPRDWR